MCAAPSLPDIGSTAASSKTDQRPATPRLNPHKLDSTAAGPGDKFCSAAAECCKPYKSGKRKLAKAKDELTAG